MKFITSNLLEVGARLREKPTAKRSRQLAAQVKQAVQRLKQKRNKTAAEVRLLDRVKTEHDTYY